MKKLRRWFALLSVFALIVSVQIAHASEANSAQRPGQSTGAGGEHASVERLFSGPHQSVAPEIDWDRVAYGMAAVLALLFLGIYGLKKLRARGIGAKGHCIEVLESRTLARKEKLFLIQVGERAILIASTGETITRVAEFDADELPQRTEDTGADQSGQFASLIRSQLGGSA